MLTARYNCPPAVKSALKFPPYSLHPIALAALYVDRAE